MFSNAEVEALKDRKDKLQSKLYCKLIMFLADPVPESRRGHHASIAFLFRYELKLSWWKLKKKTCLQA